MAMQRIATEGAALPASVPQRDRREDHRFDVPEALDLRRPAPLQPVRPRIVSTAHGPMRELMLWYPPGKIGRAHV